MYKTNKRLAAVHLTAEGMHSNNASQQQNKPRQAFRCASGHGHERAWARACLQSHEHSQYPRGVSRLAALEGSLSPSRRGPSGQPEVAVRTLPLHTVLNLTSWAGNGIEKRREIQSVQG